MTTTTLVVVNRIVNCRPLIADPKQTRHQFCVPRLILPPLQQDPFSKWFTSSPRTAHPSMRSAHASSHHSHAQHNAQHQKIWPWWPPERSRHRPYLPPHMGDGLQTFFILLPTSLRINRCVGSSSATPVSTSGADDHHGHTNSRFRPLVTWSNSRWSHLASNLHQTTSLRFRIIRGSIPYVLVIKRWVLFA